MSTDDIFHSTILGLVHVNKIKRLLSTTYILVLAAADEVV